MPIADVQSIDEALCDWRQGDACLDPDLFFVHIADLKNPLTESSLSAASDGDLSDEPEIVATTVSGIVVVSQTCDVVRSGAVRPYVEVAVLLQVDEEFFAQVLANRRPNYAALPALAGDRFVADLDRTMTIEKAVLAKCTRTPGWKADAEIRQFAEALARRRSRFAFPDDFVREFAGAFSNRIKSKHNRQSDEGRFLRALREIRVRASPSWNSPKVTIEWWFVKGGEPDELEKPKQGWDFWLGEWMKLLPSTGTRYKKGWSQALNLEDMTARDYVESDRLDYDNLSPDESDPSADN